MKKRLTKELRDIGSNSVILVILPKENYHELNMHMIKMITKKNPRGAYVSINRPYSKIVALMEEKNIGHEKIFFIDCVTEQDQEAKNCVFIKSAKSLTNIGIALDKIYKSKEHAFIFLDSIDGLSVYHSPDVLIRFVRSIIEKIREKEKIGLMIGLHEGTDKKIMDEISISCDKIINLAE